MCRRHNNQLVLEHLLPQRQGSEAIGRSIADSLRLSRPFKIPSPTGIVVGYKQQHGWPYFTGQESTLENRE